jgi:hypothetical protein
MIIQKYGVPSNIAARTALPSDAPHDDAPLVHGDEPLVQECTDVYDDTKASVPFGSIAFSSSLTHGCDLSQLWVVDSASSTNLTAFHTNLHLWIHRVGGVGVDVMGSGKDRLPVLLVSRMVIHRTIHALYTLGTTHRAPT